MTANTARKNLIDCLRSSNLAEVRALLRAAPDAARSPQAMVEAARLGWTKALDLLLKHGADPNAIWRGYRPLHALIQEAPHRDQETVVAARISCLKWLLANGADPEQLGGWPPTRAILTAAFVGQPEYTEALRKAGAVVDGFVSAALGDLRRVEKLLARDAGFVTSRDPGGLTALHCCAASRLGARSTKIVDALFTIARLLLDQGADINAIVKGWGHDLDVVYLAVSASQLKLFELLLERGADPTAALPTTVWRHDTEFAELALRHGAKIDRAVDDGKPLLNHMIRWGQIRPALWLLEHDASPNVPDEHGWTALHQAASRGNVRVLKAALEPGGDRSRRDNDGKTPLDIARAGHRAKIVALLSG